MSRFRRLYSLLTVAALALGAAACVGGADVSLAAPEAADPTDDPLALTFDALSQQAEASGDRSHSEGFAHAAISVRRGVEPSRLDVSTSEGVEAFDAFVTALDWESFVSQDLRAPSHRMVIAWRRGNNGLTRIITLMTPVDSALIYDPSSVSLASSYASFFAGASAQYQEIYIPTNTAQVATQESFWAGIRGFVKIRELSSSGSCVERNSNVIRNISCQKARYAVKFDVVLKRLKSRPVNVDDTSPERKLSAAEQSINGLKLKLSCASAGPRQGCP